MGSAEASARWRAKNLEHVRQYGRERAREKYTTYLNWVAHLKTQYKMTAEEYWWLFHQQDGRCAICLEPQIAMVVDHDHSCCPGPKSCGECVRGLLCGACNSGIGYFRDHPDALRRAVEYVERALPARPEAV